MMRHWTAVVLAALLAALTMACAVPARAAGINLFWNDCSLGPTSARNRSFACNTNEGSHVLVGSFDPPAGISMLNGMNAIVDLTAQSCPMTSWWQFHNVGACRVSALYANAVFEPGQTACADPWQGGAFIGVTAYLMGFGGDYRRARVGISASIPEGLVGSVEAGTEYYAFNLVIRNTKTVGLGSCEGCTDQTCMLITEILLTQPAGAPGGSPTITNPRDSNIATWQQQSGPGCICFPCQTPAPCATPTLNRTWGQLKGVYR